MFKFQLKSLFSLSYPVLFNCFRHHHKKLLVSSTCSFILYSLFHSNNSTFFAKSKPKFLISAENTGFTIFSKESNAPLSSGFFIAKDGTFVTILNIFSSEGSVEPKNINSSLYYAETWNGSKSYPLMIDYVIPEENLAFGHIVRVTSSDDFSNVEFVNSDNFEIGNKVYLFSKSSKKNNIIDQGFIIDKGINGIDMMMNMRSEDTTCFGSAVMNKEGKIIGMVQPTNPDKFDMNFLMIGGTMLKNICEQYVENKEVKKAYLGLSVKNSNNNLTVIKINSGGPASLAGVKLGDVIQEVNGKIIETMNDFIRLVGYKKNEKILLKVNRGGIMYKLEIKTD